MLIELIAEERQRILPMVSSLSHELSIPCVIHGSSPGEVWVDDRDKPRCGLVKTTECNAVFGRSADDRTIRAIFGKIGYFGTVTCAAPEWNEAVETHHMNSAIRKYARLSYSLNKGRLSARPCGERPLILRLADLGKLEFGNKEIVLDWISIPDRACEGGQAIAAVIVKDGRIVCCSAVDCLREGRAEIGIKTMEGFRRRGYGLAAAGALASSLFEEGIGEIGWHCVATNSGSIAIAERLGFARIGEYDSFAPYPPIENDDDLDEAGWAEYALFFEERARRNPDHLWQAAKCWAKGGKADRSIACIEKMADAGLFWFKDYLDDSPEFSRFSGNGKWKALMERTRDPAGSSGATR